MTIRSQKAEFQIATTIGGDTRCIVSTLRYPSSGATDLLPTTPSSSVSAVTRPVPIFLPLAFLAPVHYWDTDSR
jgi:hypothetical protein